ncbi:unnamed protein product [Prorocentrum cordatum]|uniref:Uncharacterized protein n=1 Tax=Prorocentrum cordatum TaxID=2364126 RepID=A0ABN9VZY6_9DINO|nr:unnamed protein product [Polarella glacialis]
MYYAWRGRGRRERAVTRRTYGIGRTASLANGRYVVESLANIATAMLARQWYFKDKMATEVQRDSPCVPEGKMGSEGMWRPKEAEEQNERKGR